MYDTIGGQVTRGQTYAKLMEHLREAQECCAVLGHLAKTESGLKDDVLAKGWYWVAELMRRVQLKVTALAQGDLN